MSEKVTSIETFLDKLPRLSEKMTGNYYYRGQTDVDYKLLPAVLRGNLEAREREIYNEVLTECSSDFVEIQSHAEILSKMQHYGIPTRLFDITNNPLVALYFACETNESKDGVVYYMMPDSRDGVKSFDSDTISLLSCLPRFSNKDKSNMKELIKTIRQGKISEKCTEAEIKEFNNDNIIKRLLHEVKKEKPAFENIIIPDDLIKKFFFLPRKNNARIIRQGGGFVIFGLDNPFSNGINREEFNFCHNKIIIDKGCKTDIINQLSCFGISKATLFPELYTFAEHLKEKYLR